jgi:hypothetical protein
VSEGGDRQQGARELPESREAALPDRLLRAIAKAENGTAHGAAGVPADGGPGALAAYQEIVLLKVALERETARVLGEAADLSVQLVSSAQALRGKTDQDPS